MLMVDGVASTVHDKCSGQVILTADLEEFQLLLRCFTTLYLSNYRRDRRYLIYYADGNSMQVSLLLFRIRSYL